ncbi:hypothetical protein FACS189427_04730 [Planctomycetales bacterium]|nr:hypothetical protein FACS189427_04730 [Planctomycetales bacterium]
MFTTNLIPKLVNVLAAFDEVMSMVAVSENENGVKATFNVDETRYYSVFLTNNEAQFQTSDSFTEKFCRLWKEVNG